MAAKKSMEKVMATYGKPVKCSIGVIIVLPKMLIESNSSLPTTMSKQMANTFKEVVRKTKKAQKVDIKNAQMSIADPNQVSRILSQKAQEAKQFAKQILSDFFFGSMISGAAGESSGLSYDKFKENYNKQYDDLMNSSANAEMITLFFLKIDTVIGLKKSFYADEPGQIAVPEIYGKDIISQNGKYVFHPKSEPHKVLANFIKLKIGSDIVVPEDMGTFHSVVLLDESY